MDGAAQPKGREVLEEAASNLWFKARQQKSPTVHIMFVCLLCDQFHLFAALGSLYVFVLSAWKFLILDKSNCLGTVINAAF